MVFHGFDGCGGTTHFAALCCDGAVTACGTLILDDVRVTDRWAQVDCAICHSARRSKNRPDHAPRRGNKKEEG